MKRAGDTDGSAGQGKKSSRKSGSVDGVDDAEFRGYVNLNLGAAEKAVWLEWAQTSVVWDALDYQVSCGVNVSVKRDRKNDAFVASGTQRDPKSPNAGLVVTARGRSAAIALSRLIFSLGVLDRTERWEDTQAVADPDRW